MQPEDEITLYRLLTEEPVATLAVIVESKPVTGLLPFVAAPDLQAVYIHASSLARHTAGLNSGEIFSLMIWMTRREYADPLQVPRVSLEGETMLISREAPDYQGARQLFIDRFPGSVRLFSFQDFNLYRLEFSKGRFVAGFARAYNISPKSLSKIIPRPAE
jgi:putative heme iron utilization protein